MSTSLVTLVSTGVGGAVLGAVGRWVLDEWSAERGYRRQISGSVTEQISRLANEHYWSLANGAGVLAGLVEGYLDQRTYHMMMRYADLKDLARRLDEIAEEVASDSFHHFCRLLWLFDRFQFQGSNTYLLRNHSAGEKAKQLYNTFMACLPTGTTGDRINTLGIVRVMGEPAGDAESDATRRNVDLPTASFRETVAERRLKHEQQCYRQWIGDRIPDVAEAAQALRAYNELLHHELADVYRDFFRGSLLGRGLPSDGDRGWPHLLTEDSIRAIERAQEKSTLLRPLGVSGPLEGSRTLETTPRENGSGPGPRSETRNQIKIRARAQGKPPSNEAGLASHNKGTNTAVSPHNTAFLPQNTATR